MKKVTGVGGIFFKANDPAGLYHWYEQHLGIKGIPGQGSIFPWQEAETPHRGGFTVWSIFPQETEYFGSSSTVFMINYRVDDLQALLDSLQAAGITILGREDSEYGRFAWILDGEGNRVELWEPPQ